MMNALAMPTNEASVIITSLDARGADALRLQHMAAIQSKLVELYSAVTANKMLRLVRCAQSRVAAWANVQR